MSKRLTILLMMITVLPVFVFAGTTGKIAGVVQDKDTGEPLIGANVQILGTMMGDASDEKGNFVILNVPVGKHDVKVTYVGYASVIREDVSISVDLTTDIMFDLSPATIEGETVVITAERPLVNKNATNETHILTAQDMENMPIRSYAGIVATNTGVVAAKGDMYVRGGRTNEIAYYIDGIYNNDLRTGDRVGDIPITSIGEINYQAGGFNAEYGFANSGLVLASSKAGASEYSLVGEIITDEFLSQKDKFLGVYSYGYNTYSLTASGPVPFLEDNLSFFLSGEKLFRRDRSPSSGTHPVVDGEFTYDEIMMDREALQMELIPEEEWLLPIKNVTGPVPYNSLDTWSVNGNLLLKVNPVSIQIGGNGSTSEWYDFDQARALLNGSHIYLRNNFNYSIYGKVTHTLGANTFYQFNAYYSAYGNEAKDPLYGRNLFDYGDKDDVDGNGVSNPTLYDNGIVVESPLRLGSGIYFYPGVPAWQYDLNRASVIGTKFDFTHQIGKTHEMKGGFEFRYNTIRRYHVTRPYMLAGIYDDNPTVEDRLAARSAYVENFGYPAYFEGHEVDPSQTLDSGLDGAKHPMIGALYVQDKIELNDLVLNLGLRADYIDANDKRLKDVYNVEIKDGTIDPNTLEETEYHLILSPRLGFSFPVTDRTVFHSQYGVFIQQPELQYLYTGWDYYAGQLLQGNQVEIGNPDLKPTKTTSYEVGIGQQLSDNSSLSITAFYKEITDNVVLKSRYGASPVTYPQYQNGDYGNVKGLSFTYKLRRIDRISGNVNYTLQYASGTGSTSSSNFYVTWIGQDSYYPVFVAPLDYDQRHTISANIDIVTKPDDGPTIMGYHIFGDMVFNILAEIGSGFPYTPKKIADTIYQARFSTAYPVGATNSSLTNWTHNIDLKIVKKINISAVDLDVYVWVLNLLGSKQPFNRKIDRWNYESGIYEATGRPDDNGWLSTTEGQRWVESNGGQRAVDMYSSYINFPDNWNSPRQIRVGLRVGL
jgi:outer membrane receptor protein involved in Fe transport